MLNPKSALVGAEIYTIRFLERKGRNDRAALGIPLSAHLSRRSGLLFQPDSPGNLLAKAFWPEKPPLNIQQNLIAGVLTLIPLAAVWFVLKLILDALSYFGSPWAAWVTATMEPLLPKAVSDLLTSPMFLYVVGTAFALFVIYLVGSLATRVIGQQLLGGFETLLERVPFVHMIYSSTKKVVAALQPKSENVQRVVLIDFPNADMRAIGFAMRTFTETTTGRELTAVFVPTAPNPTSGYLEIVPTEKVIPVDMTADQAMAMIVSGGVVGPEKLTFLHRQPSTPLELPMTGT